MVTPVTSGFLPPITVSPTIFLHVFFHNNHLRNFRITSRSIPRLQASFSSSRPVPPSSFILERRAGGKINALDASFIQQSMTVFEGRGERRIWLRCFQNSNLEYPDEKPAFDTLVAFPGLMTNMEIEDEAELNGELESEDGEFGSEIVSEGGLEEVLERKNVETCANKESTGKLPNLSIKEKKELASYAHSLGKKLKSQQVGKSGVTDNVIMALVETLEANELLKLKIHNNCPGEMDDVVKHLEVGTGSVVVGQIGRTVILYRPSLTKLKAEEKKQVHRNFMKKPSTLKQSQSRTPLPNKPNAGRRGSSRFAA